MNDNGAGRFYVLAINKNILSSVKKILAQNPRVDIQQVSPQHMDWIEFDVTKS